MSHFDALKCVRNEVGISKHIPITHLNTPSIFESSHGMLGIIFKLEGVAFDAEGNELLNQYKFCEHAALSALDERYAVYITIHRHKAAFKLKGCFNNSFAQTLNDRYHDQFKNKALFINDLYLTLLYKGITSGKLGKGVRFINRLSYKTIKNARVTLRQKQIDHLTHTANQLLVSLSIFKPRILGQNDAQLGYSEVLNFLGLPMNAGETAKATYPSFATPIGKSLQGARESIALYPNGRLSQFLPRKRLFFGEAIQFQGATQSDTTFAAMLSIKRYGSQSAPVMFDSLLNLNTEFISTHSYAIEAKDVVLKAIQRHSVRMENVDDPAVSQREALHEAQDKLASDQINMGYHHNTVMVFAPSKDTLEQAVACCLKCYSDAGFVAVRETLGQEPAFWAQIPTNFKYVARSSLITSENFVDFAPFHNYSTGYSDQNHLGSAVTLLETPSKTPYRFNFHAKGSPDNPSKGHTLIIGGNGSGKTALMTFMDAQLGRYQGTTFYFDRDRGAEIYLRAAQGTYAILSPSHKNTTQFAPLQLEDTPVNRQFNRDLLLQFCRDTEDEVLEAELVEQLTQCIQYAYEHLAPQCRTFSNAVKILPVSFPKRASLNRWLHHDSVTSVGEYAYLFDNVTDQLTVHKKMGFDLTHFLDNESPSVKTALMMYLFHRIDLTIEHLAQRDGHHLTTVMLDEGWQYFLDPYWEKKLKRVLPTWRKRNAHLVMATQSPSSVVQSPLRSVLMDNVATQIYFANPQAQQEDYLDGLKLSDSEYEIIRSNTPESRLFLVKQEHESVLCRLNLAHMPDVLAVLSGNTKTVHYLDGLRDQLGDDSNSWLPVFQQTYQTGKR